MQTWRDAAVRNALSNALLEDEASTPFVQRKHVRIQRTGFATVGHAAAAGASRGRPSLIADAINEARKEARNCA